MGAGYVFIDHALHDQYGWQVLLLLGGLKILTTATSFASGTPGGLFAPTLFIGAMIGAGVGAAAQHAPFGLQTTVSAYALVGMGTLFAGIIRAPMTSAIMILEVSGNYSIILPVMISNAIAYVISRRFQPTPIFDLLTRQEGLDLPSMEELREEQSWRVEDAMRTDVGPMLRAHEPVGDASRDIEGTEQPWLLVRMGRGYGVVARAAVEQSAAEGPPDRPLESAVMLAPLPYVHPDQSLERALRLLVHPLQTPDGRPQETAVGRVPRPLLPVVHRADATRVIGVLALQDVLQAYGKLREG
jgi:CIC family chloride channel protein